ncbi:MAG TPA: hypothetical protein VHF24_05505 [Acidimicrobiales bacterium]|nr:hypothetical protein [Acidimicrobiales bacterium]
MRAGGLEETAAHVGAYREAGVDGFFFKMAHTSDPDQIRRAGWVLRPLVA